MSRRINMLKSGASTIEKKSFINNTALFMILCCIVQRMCLFVMYNILSFITDNQRNESVTRLDISGLLYVFKHFKLLVGITS